MRAALDLHPRAQYTALARGGIMVKIAAAVLSAALVACALPAVADDATTVGVSAPVVADPAPVVPAPAPAVAAPVADAPARPRAVVTPAPDADAPVVMLSDATFDANFQCPETLPDKDSRIDEYVAWTRWARAAHPDWTFRKRLDVRYGLLRRHGCQTTLANISSSGKPAFGP